MNKIKLKVGDLVLITDVNNKTWYNKIGTLILIDVGIYTSELCKVRFIRFENSSSYQFILKRYLKQVNNLKSFI